MVAIILLLKYPIIIAIIAANILGLLSISIDPVVSRNIGGNIIAGKMADGTYDKTFFVFSFKISFFKKKIIENLVK